MDKISIKAPAKINLYLKVLGKRPDGYHDIESLMQTIDLYDEIILEKSESIGLECDDDSIGSGPDNLALKAAFALRERISYPGIRIILKKNIPPGSGLGGGSSDAAFVIRGISELYDLRLSPDEKLELAAEIGSDVPFFLSGGQAIITGRGENVHSVEFPTDYAVLLIVPEVTSSTAEAYGKTKITLTTEHRQVLFKRKIDSSSFYKMIGSFYNDLEDAVFIKLPELAKIKETLKDSGAVYSSMTGSGCGVFGIYRKFENNIPNLKTVIFPGARVFYCRPVAVTPFC